MGAERKPDNAPAAETSAIRPIQRPALAGRRILFVDDDPAILRTYRRLARTCDVTVAESLEEAMTALTRAGAAFDLVLADLTMPGGGGVALHRAMLSRFGVEAPRVVFASGGATCDEDQRYVETSGCECLWKPVSMSALDAAIAGERER